MAGDRHRRLCLRRPPRVRHCIRRRTGASPARAPVLPVVTRRRCRRPARGGRVSRPLHLTSGRECVERSASASGGSGVSEVRRQPLPEPLVEVRQSGQEMSKPRANSHCESPHGASIGWSPLLRATQLNVADRKPGDDPAHRLYRRRVEDHRVARASGFATAGAARSRTGRAYPAGFR